MDIKTEIYVRMRECANMEMCGYAEDKAWASAVPSLGRGRDEFFLL
jgi:hypothetical protein